MGIKRIKTKLVMLVVLLSTLMPGSFAFADGSGAMSPFPITGAFSAFSRADQDNVSIIEFGGNYDKSFANGDSNVEPRAVIAREFYRTHPDNYDFLVVFSSFEFNTGDAVAFHWAVQNKVQGIGLPQFDNTGLFGSKGKLLGFVDMAALTRYQTDPVNPAFEWPLGVLAHEMLHQWGSFVKFKQSDNLISKALLGRMDAHWSYLLDTGASVEYGAKWRDNGNGTYTSVGTRTFFSPLDLYLMGFYKASEVPNFTLIDNPLIDKTQTPQENVTVTGTPRTISINDIIAAEGPRVPDAGVSQKEFRIGFIYLVGPNQQVTDAQILSINNIRNAYMTRFAILTGGRAMAQTYPEAMPVGTAGTPGTVSGGGVRTAPANLDEGLAWLRAHQNAQGAWSDKDTTSQRDTMVAMSTLRQLDNSFTGGASALNWLAQHPSPNNDYLARQASLLAEAGQGGADQRAALVVLQNTDGGWGIGAGYQSNVLDSSLAVLALAGRGVNQAVLDKAGQYLIVSQNSDGGWSNAQGSPSRTSVTATALRALKALNLQAAVTTKAIAFLIGKQNPDGGFGDSPSTVHDTANVLQAAIAVDAIDRIHPDTAAAYLLARQGTDGSWDGSVYSTAVAVAAIKRFNFPNWAVTSIKATPVTVSDGDKIRLDIAIKNDASLVTPASVLRVYDGDPASGGRPIGPDVSVPVMGPGVTLSFSPYFDTLDKPGAHTLFAVVDPDNLQVEMSKADNRASVGVTVQTAPAEIDLALANPDITVIPVQPNRLPTTLGLSATVRNVGLTDAFAVPVVLLTGSVGNQVVVASTVVDVLNRSNVVVNFNYLLTTAGTVNFTVQVDPDNSIPETNKANNSATASVTTSPSVDLAVSNVDISVDKNPVLVGDDINFKVVLHNSGTVDSPAAEVRYTITDGNTTKTLRTNTVQIGAGQTLEQQIVWRVDMTGTLRFSAQLDPSALVPEADKTNNTGNLTLSSGTVSGPNLVVTYKDFTFSPMPGLEGGNVVLTAVVRNTGTVVANNIPVVFYLGDPSINDVLAMETIVSLAPNTSATVTTTWAGVPTPGDKLLFVIVDPDDTITEFSKSDNSAFDVLTVMSLPDLAISSGDVKFTPGFPRAGETLTIQAQVANLGDQSAANVVVRAFDGDPANGGTQIGTDQTIPSIAGHGAGVVSFSLNLAAVSATRPIVIQVDPADQILERNKANNTAQHDLAVQDGNFFVSNLFFSPNGDGIKDTTEFFFRLSSATTVNVEVVNKRDVVVRRFSGDALANVTTASVVWDGLDDAGRLVQDGPYKLRIVGTSSSVTGEVKVTLDTNRSSLLDSVNTRYGSFSNLTCELPVVDLKFTQDDAKAFFGISTGSSPQVAYPHGIYSMDGTGGDIRAIVPESFFPPYSYTYWGYNYSTRSYGNINATIQTAANLEAIAANGSKVVFTSSNNTRLQWIADGDGKNLQQFSTPGQSNSSQFSNNGKILYSWKNGNRLVGISTEPGAIERTIWTSPQYSYVTNNLSYSPDNTKTSVSITAYDRNENSVDYYEVIDLESGGSFSIPSEPAWSPDGKYVVTGFYPGYRFDSVETNINIYDMTGDIVKSIPSPVPALGGRIVPFTGKPVWNLDSTEFAISIGIMDASYSCAPLPEGSDLGGIFTVDVATGTTRKIANFSRSIDAECGASYHISTWNGAQWVEREVLHYGLFMQQQSANLSKYLPDSEGKYRVRIRQTGQETAHVDDVALSIDHQRVAPSRAVHLGTNADALAKVSVPDNEVLYLHEATLEVQWDKPPKGGQIDLVLGAREESISKRTDLLPFSYPASAGQVYNYMVTGKRPMVVDGNQTGQDNLGEPLFKVYSRPGTGHPSANVYGYAQSDDQYLYAALDFTVDNDEDGVGDWATIRIRKAGVWKDYRVTKTDKTHGQVGFIHTGKVSHSHKYYEFKIALADIDAHAGDTLDIAFQGYGSAAINTTPQSTDLSPNQGVLYWVPGERSLIYYNYDGNYGSQYTAIKLDEQNSHTVLFADWMDNYANQVQNLRFSPAGRQIFFDSARDANNPASRCYQQGDDTWSFHSLLNLSADLRAVRTGAGGVRLEGSAADQNFAAYSLDYANADTPDQWHPVLPSANIPVIDDIFTTWVPPAAGTYFVRLTVQDLAGNTRQSIKRVSWSDTPSITDLYRTPNIISPNGDGVQDEATIHYRVLEPVHLEFNFFNKTNDRVRTIVRDHSAPGVETNVIWDGRDDNGLPVVDGVYRMTVQNYEFFITVDTKVPSTNLILNSAYQPRYEIDFNGQPLPRPRVKVAPTLSWDVSDENYLSSVVETGSGSNPLFWSELVNPDPLETGKGDPHLLPLTLDQFVSQSFRLSAKDTAGNSSAVNVGLGVVTAVPAKEELIVTGVGIFAINPVLAKNHANLPTGTKLGTSAFNALVAASGGLLAPLNDVFYVPMQQQDGGTELSAVMSSPQARFSVAETIRIPLAQIFVQFRKPVNPLWTEKLVAGYAVTDVSEPVLLTTPVIPDQVMNAIGDLTGLEAGKVYVVRLRAIDAAGNEHFSNSFQIATGDGFGFNGLILDSSPDWPKYIAPMLNTPLSEGEYVLWGTQNISQPISEVKLFIRSSEDPRYATDRLAGTVKNPAVTFIFRTQELQVCTKYTGYIVLLGEPDATGVKQEIGRSSVLPITVPCLKLKTDVQVQFAAACNTPSPNQVKVRFAPSSLASEAPLKLLTLSRQDPIVGKDIVFNVNKPTSVLIPSNESMITYPYEFLLDTSALPEGTLQFQAELTNVNDDVVTRSVTVVVDHTPPVIAITYPTESQGVCGVPVEGQDGITRNVVTIEGSMADANGLHYEMDSSTTGESTLSLLHKSRSYNDYNSILAANGVQPPSPSIADKQQFHLPSSYQGPLAAVFDKTGTITSRLRVFDQGGYQQCVIRSFQFDGSVVGISASLDRTLFSPNGDGVADSVSITYAADESAMVDIDIFQAGNDSNGEMYISGDSLRSLAAQAATLAGSTSIEWDGRAGGGVVLDGKYGIQVTFTDSCGNVAKLVRYVEVDNTRPAISVNYPTGISSLPLIVEIQGAIADLHLQSYTIDFGVGLTPDAWVRLKSGTSNVSNGVLAPWNTYGLQGPYTLRLIGIDMAGNQSTILIPVNVQTPLNIISALEVMPTPFSPNGDGRRESTAIRVSLDQDAVITLAVKNAQGVTRRTLVSAQPLNKGAASFSWDGNDDVGQIVPDGVYTIGLLATLSSNSFVKQDEKISVVIDSTAPLVDITRPAGIFVTATGGVMGSITDQYLSSYTVSITNSPRSPIWNPIDTGTLVRNNAVLGSLAGFSEGDYAIRIEAQDDAENKVDRIIPFSIDNTPPKVELSAPADGSFVGIKKLPVNIVGMIDEKNIKSYTLEFADGESQAAWTTLATGNSLPLPSILKAWDVSALQDGLYSLRLTALDQAGLTDEIRELITVDNTAPTVSIASPVEGNYVKAPQDVTGSVNEINLANYRIEIAPGAKGVSANWSELGAGTAEVNNGKLLSWQALPPDGLYTLRLSAKDKSDNYAEAFVQLSVDTHPPLKSTGLKAEVKNRQDVNLSWTANGEPDLAGYSVYRDGALITSALVLNPAYVDYNVSEGQHSYQVIALDKAGWESVISDPAMIVVDITPPTTHIQSPANLATVSGLVDVRGTAYSTNDFKEYRLFVAQSNSPDNRLLLRRSPVPITADILFQWNTLGLMEGATYVITLEAEDINSNIGMEQVSVVIDNLPPLAPTGLTAQPAGANVQMNWNSNTEDDLLGYLVYRNNRLANVTGTLVGDLRPYAVPATQYPDNNLADGPYTYTVYAIDKAGNMSLPSNVAQVSIDTRPPHTTLSQPASGAKFDTPQYVLAVSADTDIASVQFQYRALTSLNWINLGVPVTTLPYATTFDPVMLGLVSGNYQIQSIATDNTAKVDPAPTPVDVSYVDITRPAMALGLTSLVTGGDVALKWTANIETDLAGYYIDRDSLTGTVVRITPNPITTSSYVDANLADGIYIYTITAVDLAGNLADPSLQQVLVYTPVLSQPYTPTKNTFTAILQGSGVANATVNANVTTTASTASLPSLNSDADGKFAWAGLPLLEGDNVIEVTLKDAAGNVSKTAQKTVTFGNAPSKPTAVNASTAGYDVTVNWTANPETNIIGYRVFRNDQPLLPLTQVTGATATASSSAYEYYYAASKAIDGNPNTWWYPASLEGEWLAVSWAGNKLVSHVSVTWYKEVNNDFSAVDFDIEAWSGLDWVKVAEIRNNQNAVSDVDLAQAYLTSKIRVVLHSALRQDGSQVAEVFMKEIAVSYAPTQAATTIFDIAPDGNQPYTVTAVNNFGFESVPSAPSIVTVGDVIAPDAVTLTGSVSGSDVNLIWTASASTDVARYVLYRDGTLISTVTDLANLSYVDMTRPNGTYHYTVTAIDAVNNESVASNDVGATVAIALPPTPVNLGVTVVPAGGALDLLWSAGGGVNPAAYRVLRSTVSGGPYQSLGDTVATQKRDSGLTNGITYFYVVAALDALGNSSVLSNESSGTPQDQVAPVVTLYYPTLAGKIYRSLVGYTDIVARTEPGAMVKLYQNGNLVGQAQARSIDNALFLGNNSYLSPDGRYTLGNANNYQDIVLHSIETQSDTVIVSSISEIYDYLWSDDSSQVIYYGWDANSGTYYISAYRLSDKTTRYLVPSGVTDTVNVFSLSPDQTQLAIVANYQGTYGLWRVDIATGNWSAIPTSSPYSLGEMSWSPDGTRLALISYLQTSQISVIHLATGIETIIETMAGYSTPSWSPDGSSLLYSSLRDGSEQIWKWTLANGIGASITQGPNQHEYPSWSPDSKAIAFVEYQPASNNSISIILDIASGAVRELTDYSGIHWLRSGYISVANDNGQFRIEPAGRVEFKNMALSPGDNIFNASVIDLAGNAGLPSASVDVNYGVNDRADLVVTENDITILPAVPRANEATRISVSVKNQGSVASQSTFVSLVMVDPTGTLTTLLDGDVLGSLNPGGSQMLAADWLAPALAGDYKLVAIVDPQDQVPEISESNNLAIRIVHIAGTAKPEVRIVTDKQAYLPAENVQVTADAINGGDTFNGKIEVVIEDMAGYLVQKILSQNVVDLPYAQKVNVASSWNTGITFAGSYQAHVTLFDVDNLPVADARTPFTLGVANTLNSTITTDKAVYIGNSNIHAAATFNYSGNAVLVGAQRVLRIQNANAVTLFQEQQVLGDMLPGASGSASLDWNSGNVAPGSYQAIMEISKAGVLLSTARTAFSIQASTNLLSGKLSLSDQAPAVGIAQTTSFTVSNLGNANLSQVPLHVSLVDPDLQSTLQTQLSAQDIGVGAQATGSVIFTTAGLQLKTYTVVLSADVLDANGSPITLTLATASFPLVDRTPPDVVLRQPVANGFIRGDATDIIFAKDNLSLVKAVEISIDGAGWALVPVSNPSQYFYGDVLNGLTEGIHTITARATDTWSNTGSTAVNSFIVDNTPPQIVISGAANAKYYNVDVSPSAVATDANLDKTTVLLNGNAAISGTPIQIDGIYTLTVLANDKAGNTAQQGIRFVVDKTAPTVLVTGIQNNSFYNTDVIPVINVTDTNLESSAITLNGQPFGSGTTVSAEGIYQLNVTAKDLAGNVNSTVVQFTIDKTPPVILISGVADAKYYNVDVIPSVVASDTNLDKTTVTLNGIAYIPGTPIQTDGSYNLTVLASDKAGNTAQQVINFAVDKATPAVLITGIQNMGLYNTDVMPVITVTDTNPGASTITLNGQPFGSGTTVSAEGVYQLSVTASDLAGNVNLTVVQFTIDKTPPTLSVSSPVDGVKVTANVINVQGSTEANANVTLSVGSYQVTLVANTQGQFTFVQIPLVAGLNTIKVSASDLAGNISPSVAVTVTLQVATAEIHGEIKHNGHVLVWLPSQHEQECESHNDNDHSKKSSSGYRSAGSFENSGESHRGANAEDPYAELIALIDSTLRSDGADYRVVRNKDDFVTALRSRRYTTLLFGELQSATNAKSLELDDDIAKEVQATVASGVGLAWIKTHPNEMGNDGERGCGSNHDDDRDGKSSKHDEGNCGSNSDDGKNCKSNDHDQRIDKSGNHDEGNCRSSNDDERVGKSDSHDDGSKAYWDRFFGAKITGVLPNLTQLELTNSASSQAGKWVTQPSFGLQVRGMGGSLVGNLTPGNKPALVLNRYGNGNVALVTFDPSSIVDPQGAISTLHNVLQFAVPVTTTLLPSALAEIRWDASKLSSPLDVRFEEYLPTGMAFLELNGGQIVSGKEAVWEQHLDIDHATFEALVRLPGSVGTFETSATLLQKQGGNLSPLVSDKLTISVTADRSQLGVQVTDTLNKLVVSNKEKTTLANAIISVRNALSRHQVTPDEIRLSIDDLSHAEVLIASLAGDNTDLLSKVGLLMTTYQLAWVEAMKEMNSSLTAGQVLSQFNLVVLGNATSSSHVDGRSFIGGNLQGGTYVQHPSDTPASAYAGLTVQGNAGNVMVNNFGVVTRGGLSNSTVNSGPSAVFGNVISDNFNGPAYVKGASSGSNFNGGHDASLATGTAVKVSTSTNFGFVLTSLSRQLSHLASTGSTVIISGNKATFNAVANASGVAVFDLTRIDTAVFRAGEFQFNLNGATMLILNSDEKSATIAANFLGGSARTIGAKTLWNFYEATNLEINNEWGGSILAPLAHFKNGNNIEGDVLVDSLDQRGEIHLQSFYGQIPKGNSPSCEW